MVNGGVEFKKGKIGKNWNEMQVRFQKQYFSARIRCYIKQNEPSKKIKYEKSFFHNQLKLTVFLGERDKGR